MSVSSANSTSSSYNVGYSDLYNSSGTAARKTTKTLGSDEFMKLLAVQFQTQDPMKPMEDTAFIAQMAQFSSLQQMSDLRTSQQLMTAASYIGTKATVADASGKEVSGEVTAIENTSDGVMLTIDGEAYSISTVRRIEPIQPLTTSNATENTTPAA